MILLDFVRWLLVGVAALWLLACGGGGGSSAPLQGETRQAPPAPRKDLLFGYFGAGVDQVAHTADHVNVVWLGGWSIDADMAILREARQNGISKVIANPSLLLYPGGRYVGQEAARAALRAYFARIQEAEMLQAVVAVSPQDEPDTTLADRNTLQSGIADIRAVAAEFGLTPAIAVNFSTNRGWYALELIDWISCDDYSVGICETPRLLPWQRWMLIPGGADPWRNDPGLFVQRAQTDPTVVAVIAFIWLPFTFEGRLRNGIGSNGLQDAYRAAGKQLTGGGG